MTPRPGPRTTACSPSQAKVRLTQARTFLDVADLVLNEKDAAHYSPQLMSKSNARAVVGNARSLVEFAERS